MVPSTAPEDIAAYAWRVASSWKLGRQEIGDGSLIVVAKNDRRMRIEVARKLEGAIPDIMAARIIDGAMKPRFRNDDYVGGLSAAIDQMSLLIHGEKLPAPEPRRASKSWTQYTDFLLPCSSLAFPLASPSHAPSSGAFSAPWPSPVLQASPSMWSRPASSLPALLPFWACSLPCCPICPAAGEEEVAAALHQHWRRRLERWRRWLWWRRWFQLRWRRQLWWRRRLGRLVK